MRKVITCQFIIQYYYNDLSYWCAWYGSGMNELMSQFGWNLQHFPPPPTKPSIVTRQKIVHLSSPISLSIHFVPFLVKKSSVKIK